MANIISKISVDGVIYDISTLKSDDATAYPSDILFGKTAYARGNKIEGTIPDWSKRAIKLELNGEDSNIGKYVINGSDVRVVPAIGFYGSFDSSVERLVINGPELAEGIGLIPEILLKDRSILGIIGTLDGDSQCIGFIYSSFDTLRNNISLKKGSYTVYIGAITYKMDHVTDLKVNLDGSLIKSVSRNGTWGGTGDNSGVTVDSANFTVDEDGSIFSYTRSGNGNNIFLLLIKNM